MKCPKCEGTVRNGSGKRFLETHGMCCVNGVSEESRNNYKKSSRYDLGFKNYRSFNYVEKFMIQYL